MFDWSSHECTYFCSDDAGHAVAVLAKPWVTAAMIAQHLTMSGQEVLRVIEAREADVAVWQKEIRGVFNRSSQRYEKRPPGVALHALTQPFLAFLRKPDKETTKNGEN